MKMSFRHFSELEWRENCRFVIFRANVHSSMEIGKYPCKLVGGNFVIKQTTLTPCFSPIFLPFPTKKESGWILREYRRFMVSFLKQRNWEFTTMNFSEKWVDFTMEFSENFLVICSDWLDFQGYSIFPHSKVLEISRCPIFRANCEFPGGESLRAYRSPLGRLFREFSDLY